ncbi:MAG: hypothetical protein BWK76_12680 [Desulfobulbaceae bacterium A2]|nr:MAG: hypothetical protein BWK76_12680 [Desulfobulbaceae bacterium A2]
MATVSQAIIVDITVVTGWCFAEAAGSYVDAALTEVALHGGLVPPCWMTEVANVLLAAETRMRLTEADSTRFLTLLQELPLRVDNTLPSRHWGDVVGQARRHGLNSAEGAYLELALRENARLASLNQRLRQAARDCHVRLFTEGERNRGGGNEDEISR